jgi:predicted NBD/HSP70 family sugar kinase
MALAKRFSVLSQSPEDPAQVLQRVLTDEENPAHRQALTETGIILADALLPAILMLNPSHVVLSGRLATPIVRDAFEEHIRNLETVAHVFGERPTIRALTPGDGEFIAVRGAALAVFRTEFHRKLPDLFGGNQKAIPSLLTKLTDPTLFAKLTAGKPNNRRAR